MNSMLRLKQESVRKQCRRSQLQQVLQESRSPLRVLFQSLLSSQVEEKVFLKELKRFTQLAGIEQDQMYQKLIAAGIIQRMLQTEFNQVTSQHLPTILTNTLAQKDHLIYALVSRPAFWRLLAICAQEDFMAVENLSLFENWHVKEKALNLVKDLKEISVKQVPSLIRTIFNLTHVQPALEYSKSLAALEVIERLIRPWKGSVQTEEFLLLLRILERLSGPHSNRVARFLQYPGLVGLVFEWREDLAFTKILQYQIKILSNLVENKGFNEYLSQSETHLNQLSRLLALDSQELLQTQMGLADQLVCFCGHQRPVVLKFREQIFQRMVQRVARGPNSARKKFFSVSSHLLQRSKLQDALRLSENLTFLWLLSEGLADNLTLIETLTCIETLLIKLHEGDMLRELIQQLKSLGVINNLENVSLIEGLTGQLAQGCLRLIGNDE